MEVNTPPRPIPKFQPLLPPEIRIACATVGGKAAMTDRDTVLLLVRYGLERLGACPEGFQLTPDEANWLRQIMSAEGPGP